MSWSRSRRTLKWGEPREIVKIAYDDAVVHFDPGVRSHWADSFTRADADMQPGRVSATLEHGVTRHCLRQTGRAAGKAPCGSCDGPRCVFGAYRRAFCPGSIPGQQSAKNAERQRNQSRFRQSEQHPCFDEHTSFGNAEPSPTPQARSVARRLHLVQNRLTL